MNPNPADHIHKNLHILPGVNNDAIYLWVHCPKCDTTYCFILAGTLGERLPEKWQCGFGEAV